MTSFWCFYCELLKSFTPFSIVSIVDFEQINSSWVISLYFALEMLREIQYFFVTTFILSHQVVVGFRN